MNASSERTVQMPDADLGAVFGARPVARRPEVVLDVDPPAVETAPVVVPPVRPARERAAAGTAGRAPAQRGRRRRRAPAAADGTGVSLPVSVRDRLRVYARGLVVPRTFTDIALDAVEASIARLPKLVEQPGAVREGPLFAGRAPKRTANEEPHVQVNLRFSQEDLDTVDDLVQELRAANRSALLAAALNAYLPE